MTEFSLVIAPRYAEIDQQGVVFNGHYLTWFDEACTGLLESLGVAYPAMTADGYDFQVVHAEIDFASPVRWRDAVRVTACCTRIGTTSFTIGFTVLARTGTGDERIAVRGHNVYVVVSATDWVKQPIPDPLRAALGRSVGR
ncbi:thioesterase family protein [Mycobacterium sp. NAZ190054]|uniref:acyl-CoA thioesterase n=1 Tax=Mycobacterium sp. NAZ190054 TaxID=1747766 RepID=UPI00079603D6|nr:thioesterase family protein [Mycobacterium sp. NAZ190054]KWX66588.1 4-hydroxybenzoyl-CoA thioesterase [Mycobacterium sp. NAZ190054]